MDDWGWEHVEPWRQHRATLPVGPFLCVVEGPTCGRGWSQTGARAELRRLAAIAGVCRRFAPHQLRHAHAVEMAREGVPLPVIQRQLGHAHLGVTSTLPTRHRHSRDHRHHPRPPTTNDLSQRRPPTLRDRKRCGRRASACRAVPDVDQTSSVRFSWRGGAHPRSLVRHAGPVDYARST